MAEQSIFNEMLDKAVAAHKAGNLKEAEPIYNVLLGRSLDNPTLLYLLSDIQIRKGFHGLAISLLRRAIELDPSRVEYYTNLGAALRYENYYDQAGEAWEHGIALGGGNDELFSNMSTLWADSGEPGRALEWLDKALEKNPEHWQAHWNKALALLSLRRWREGFESYEKRKHLDQFQSRQKIDAPVWDGSPVRSLFVHGEQGVGDEVMFLSCLPDVLELADSVVLEVNHKVKTLAEVSFPGVTVVTSEDEAVALGRHFEAKVPLGDLPGLFRSEGQFPRVPYLTPDPSLVNYYHDKLAAIGPRPWIALVWLGGNKETRVENRSIPLVMFTPVMAGRTCVAAQWFVSQREADMERELYGLPAIDIESCGGDLHHQAALFAACDLVITVQQTAVHVAGAVGAPCWCLACSRPSWRYGVEGNDLPWYGTVKVFRQGKGDGWSEVLDQVARGLEDEFDPMAVMGSAA